MTSPPTLAADRLQAALWLGLALGCVLLLAELGPILTPFLLGGILAYICNPSVDRLQALGVPRLAAVIAVLALMSGLLVAVGLILLPLIVEEVRSVASRLPQALALIEEKLLPWLAANFGVHLKLDAASIRDVLGENIDSVQAVFRKIYESAKIGGIALIGWIATAVMAPVVMFYLLLDWQVLTGRIDHMIPRRWHGKVAGLAGAVDRVLSEYLRGQLMVMAILAAYYSIALWIAGIPSALSLGALTGMLIFIPYLGFTTGLILALLVATLQFQGWSPVIAVFIVYGIGQVLEGFLLTPFLVGDRIGLHPLAVIFALMAFGQLFGFFGVLLALPAAAALLVGLRELKAHYLASSFYTAENEQ